METCPKYISCDIRVLKIYIFFVSGYLLFKEFCEQTSEEPVPHLKFYEEVSFKMCHVNTNKYISVNSIAILIPNKLVGRVLTA